MKAYNQRGALLVKPNLDDLEEQQALEHGRVIDLLEAMVLEQRITNAYLAEITDEELTVDDLKEKEA